MSNHRLLSPHQVADLLPYSVATIRRWIRTGRLRSVKLGDAAQSRRLVPYDWLCEDLKIDVPVKPCRPSRAAREAARARAEARRAALRAAERERRARRNSGA